MSLVIAIVVHCHGRPAWRSPAIRTHRFESEQHRTFHVACSIGGCPLALAFLIVVPIRHRQCHAWRSPAAVGQIMSKLFDVENE